MSFTIIEQSVVGKYSDVSLCEDALVITPFFAAVVDGATSKCDLSFDGNTTGRLASELLSGVIRSLPYDATMSEFIDEAGRVFMAFYCRNGLWERVVSEPQCRLSASVAIYSDARREVWTVGDCRLRISYDVYNFEMIIAIAFRICSKETLLFRRFVINEICTTKKGIPVTLFVSYGKNGNLWYSRGSSRQPPVPDARMQR